MNPKLGFLDPNPLMAPAPLAIEVNREKALALEAEEHYWRETHFAQPYGAGTDYEQFEAAYRIGYEGYWSLGKPGMSFAEVESELQGRYENLRSVLPWIKARPATLAAWRHAQSHPIQPRFP